MTFDNNMEFAECIRWWTQIVVPTLSFYQELIPALSAGGLDSKEKVSSAVAKVGSMLNAVIIAISPQIDELKQHIIFE